MARYPMPNRPVDPGLTCERGGRAPVVRGYHPGVRFRKWRSTTGPHRMRGLRALVGLPCLLGLALCVPLAGCGSAQMGEPLTAAAAGSDAAAQLAFWHRLAERPVTSNDEAFHGLLLFMNHAEPVDGYDGRVATLRSAGMLPRRFDRPAGEAVQRGTLAVALTKMLDIEGGVAMRLLGPSPRYATRELQYMGLYPPSAPHQTFSGVEFLGIVGRAEDYQRVMHPMQSDTIRPAEAQ